MDPPQHPVADTTLVAEQQPPEQLPQEQHPQEQLPQRQTVEKPPLANTKMTTEETKINPSYHNGYSSDSHAQYFSRATEFSHPPPPTSQDAEARLASPSITYQPQPPSSSRPSSGLSSGAERHGVVQHDGQRSQPAKNSVVIKVGMVGDAQIGKTSLMVKYVEGSWDEDYIQTLGESNGFSR